MNEMSYQNLAIMMLVTDVGELKFGLLNFFLYLNQDNNPRYEICLDMEV